jgi:hypothetical protein
VLRKPSIADTLESLKKALVDSFGDRLIAVVKYGMESESQANKIRVLIIVDQLDASRWERVSTAFENIKGRATIAPMLMTKNDLHASTDVFPITFMEMQRQYEVIHGDDVLKDLKIQHAHLRLRCEQELKNLSLRMQSTCLMHHASPYRLKNALTRNYESFVRAIGGTASLVDKSNVVSEAALIDLAVEEFKLDRDTLVNVKALVESDAKHDASWIQALYIAMMSAVESAASFVDQMPDGVVVINPIDQKE